MIDLHMHTTYSDGTDKVLELLKEVDKRNLEIISITDHNSVDSYIELENININDYYKGKIIVGCEFTTSFDGNLIEVLGYNFDYKKVDIFLKDYYTKEKINERTSILYKRLLNRLDELGFIYNIQKEDRFNNEFFERDIYKEIIKHRENFHKLDENVFKSFHHFFRNGLTNINSKLFINHAEFKPSLKETIDLIHQSGGIVLLAHPFQYEWNNMEEILNKIYNDYQLDGIECFYTTFTNKESNYLVEFAKKHKLLISGGSDYHGTNKKLHDLGVGNGSLKINKDIINNWKIKYYN